MHWKSPGSLRAMQHQYASSLSLPELKFSWVWGAVSETTESNNFRNPGDKKLHLASYGEVHLWPYWDNFPLSWKPQNKKVPKFSSFHKDIDQKSPFVEMSALNRTCGVPNTISSRLSNQILSLYLKWQLSRRLCHCWCHRIIFQKNIPNEHSLKAAGLMCWCFYKERQLLGRQILRLWKID